MFGRQLNGQEALFPNFEGAELFRQLRQILRLPADAVAHRIQTPVSTIIALEQGATSRLPPWPETVRVVTAYTALAGIDPRPILSAIQLALETGQLRARRGAPDQVKQSAQSAVRKLQSDATKGASYILGRLDDVRDAFSDFTQRIGPASALARMQKSPVKTGLSITLPLALVMSLASGGPVQAVASMMPQPVAGLVRTLQDYILHSMAPRRDGLAWIEVADPRSRKTHKLPSPQR